jgi:hypothetical protein
MRAPSDLRQHPNTHGKPYPEPLTGKLRVQTTSLAVGFPALHAQKSADIRIYRKCRNIGFREDCPTANCPTASYWGVTDE